MRLGLIANFVSFLVITGLTGLAYLLLERAGLATSNAFVLSTVSLVILIIIFLFYRRRVWRAVGNKFASIAINRFSNKIGLVQVYENFHDAQSDVRRAFEEAREARILIQLGHGIVGGNKSLLFEAAKKKKERGFQMKLLYADRGSPHLSQDRASTRGSNFTEWMAAISFTEGSIDALLEDGINIQARRHCEPYLWRLFFFDKTLFFVPYLADRNNSARAPIFKFTSDNHGFSLYWAFSEYFENQWSKHAETSYKSDKSGLPG